MPSQLNKLGGNVTVIRQKVLCRGVGIGKLVSMTSDLDRQKPQHEPY